MIGSGEPGSIGFLLHFRESPDSPTVLQAMGIAHSYGYSTWLAHREVEAAVAENQDSARLLVSIGGDGTLLYGAAMAAPRGIPILGVNRGQLGFLTSIEMAQLPAAIEAFCAGECRIAIRGTLRGESKGAPNALPPLGARVAVNEIVLRARGVTLVRMRVSVDQQLMGDFDADGLIVATSLGSTAYSLSAGGPPVDPRIPALIVTALNPHALLSRSVVIPDSVSVRVELLRGSALLASDGNAWAGLEEGGELMVNRGADLQMVEPPGEPGFFERLRSKTGFGTVLKLPYQHESGGEPTPRSDGTG